MVLPDMTSAILDAVQQVPVVAEWPSAAPAKNTMLRINPSTLLACCG
jgi:hypothetical protein